MELDGEDLLLFWYYLKRKSDEKKRLRKPRRFWVHKLLQPRVEKGLHHTLYDDLRDTEKFYTHFRMHNETFDELLFKIEDLLRKQDTVMRKSIPPDEKLALFLRYLGQGVSMTDLHLTYRLGLSTVSQIIRDVCDALWTAWRDDCFPPLTEDVLKEVAVGFQQRAQVPNCIGALDGKHVRIIKPTDTGSLYYNYKNYFSVLLLALCDSNYLFLYVDVGSYGKSSDSTVFKNSPLHAKLLNGDIRRPHPRPLPGQTDDTPFMILGDEGFSLSTFILRPFGGAFLTKKKKIFNYRHTRGRRFIECSFGLLANKWAIFHRPLNVDLELAEDLIRVGCLLHNFVRKRDGYKFEDTLTVRGFDEMPTNSTQGDRFADYFVSEEGKVPWQDEKI